MTWIDEDEAVSRLKQRNNCDESLARLKFAASQRLMSNREKLKHAHYMISTIFDKSVTCKIIEKICLQHQKVFKDKFCIF